MFKSSTPLSATAVKCCLHIKTSIEIIKHYNISKRQGMSEENIWMNRYKLFPVELKHTFLF